MKKVRILAIVFSLLWVSCSALPRSSKPSFGLVGFRDIKWGTEISALTGMVKVEEGKSSDSNFVWYTRNGDTSAIGKARLKNIIYGFWMGNFGSVWVDFEGDDNFETLKKELFERFGNVRESARDFYAWEGKDTEMSLSYSKDHHNGVLSIDSRKINEERRAYDKQRDKEKREKEGGTLK